MKTFSLALSIAALSIEASAQSYYPLKPSNCWYFDSSAYSVRVLSDSLLPNGRVYAVLSPQDAANGRFVRVDSHFVYYYDPYFATEVPFFPLNAHVGDTTRVTFTGFTSVCLTKIDTQTIFGASTRVLSYRLDGIILRQVALSEKFGPVSVSYYGDPPPPWPDFISTLTGCALDGTEYGLVVSVPADNARPARFALNQNYPNPFNPSTTITYSVSERANVRIFIADMLGRTVRNLARESVEPGDYSLAWNGKDDSGRFLPSGVYFCVMQAGEQNVFVRKMVLLK